jgi:UDP-3-O-[3-hydroxymyristoyl] glucosamine N-acyltransferase
VGISGSTTVGKYCTIAGAAGLAGHLTLCDHVHITMQAQVTRSINEPGSYSSGTGLLPTAHWRKAAVYFRKLDQVFALLKRAKAQ